jgi:DNA-3-methyladenine glycosylase I
MKRCGWEFTDPLMIAYHDEEWGVPVHDDRKLFEFMVLDAFQAGLSWSIVLKKRPHLRRAFRDFEPKRVAHMTAKNVVRLLSDPGIIRNRLKIESAIANAKRFLLVQKEFGSFGRYIWAFVGGRPIVHSLRSLRDMPATSPESDALSRDLKARGFTFVGSKICYAFMQAVGMINDHTVDCFRHRRVKGRAFAAEADPRAKPGAPAAVGRR